MDELILKIMKKVLLAHWVVLKHSELTVEEYEYLEKWCEIHYKDDFSDDDEAFRLLLNDYTLDKLKESVMLGFMD